MAASSLRERGNRHFWSDSENLSPLVRYDRLSKAVADYSSALSHLDRSSHGSGDGDEHRAERSRCHKNLASAHRRLAMVALLRHDCCGEDVASFHLSSSVRDSLDAISYGSGIQSKDWIAWIKAALLDFAAIAASDPVLGSESSLAKACKIFQRHPQGSIHASAVLHRAYCEALLRKAEEMIQDVDRGEAVRSFLAALGILSDCAAPLEVAATQCEGRAFRDFRHELRELQRRVELKRRLCESIQARKKGEDFRELAGRSRDPEQRQEILVSALDQFRESERLARDCDEEARVLALGGVGQLLVTLGLEEQGESAYTSAIAIGDSLLQHKRRKNFSELVERMKSAYQALAMRKRDHEELKTKVFMRLEANFAKNKHNLSKFLEFLLAEHPPPGLDPADRDRIVDESVQSPRSALKKALRLYHPDHNQSGKNTQWKIISQEITKFLVLLHGMKINLENYST
ncbi:hypothetical protein SELMODRAFT_404488 [Selaginella moellendorffii]|uniref:J domain-containing protein n=1 Tax=Selaginella moellendorffii TaxID=88036 RepID=D8QVH8_SELML|nr:hypothetical protein SELMODRAFT_404488 [Selaginella moellendorffii]